MRQLLGCGLAVLLAGSLPAADPVPPADLDKAVRDALQEVHNRGADLYNQAKDYPAAYRLYEGAVRVARPLLPHRPASQKRIDDGLAAAEKEADPARRAFLLHEAIEAVRADLKTPLPAAAKADPKPPGPKPDETMKRGNKADPPKGAHPPAAGEAKPKDAPPPKPKEQPAPKPKELAPGKDAGGTVAGTITFKGKPLAGADLTFVSLGLPEPKVVTVPTNAEGVFAAKGLPPGKYAVTVALVQNGKVVTPPKYATTDTSGLTAEVKAGPNQLDLNLQ